MRGYLWFSTRGGWPVHDAKLFDKRGSTREVIPTLQHAHLVKVDNGIMLRVWRAPGGQVSFSGYR